jgi:2-keto-4-pentenoate hydratase
MTNGPSRFATAAARLLDAHRQRQRFQPLPPELAPRTPEEAYLIQDGYVALRSQERGAIMGHKIALSTVAMQKFVGVDQPQAGALLQATLHRSPCLVRAADYVNLIVEFEIALEMCEGLPAADAPFSRERVAEAVGGVMPAFELADDRSADYTQLCKHPLELIADNAWNEGAVLGEPIKDWKKLDLAAVRGIARINGQEVGQGTGAQALGHPLDALAWVAGNLASRGRGLVRGDVVITGSLVTTKTAKAGDLFQWAIDGLGEIELRVE